MIGSNSNPGNTILPEPTRSAAIMSAPHSSASRLERKKRRDNSVVEETARLELDRRRFAEPFRAGTGSPPRHRVEQGNHSERDDRHDSIEDDPVEAVHDDPVRPDPAAASCGHHVMDRGAIAAALLASGFDGDYDSLSSAEEQRARTLVQYRDMPLFRPHLVGSPAMIRRLDGLRRAAPNFAAVTRLVHRAAYLSQVSGRSLRIQPIMLVGAPGIGKSRYARALAFALNTSCDIINGSTLPDLATLTGYPPVWRGAGPGRIAKFLVAAPTTGPLIFIDEAEKIVAFEDMAHPLDRLLPLLEYDTSSGFQDEYLQVPMRAQNAIFLFACNTTDGLSPPFLDRLLTIRIPDLDPAARHAVLEAMLAEVAQKIGLPMSLPNPSVLASIQGLGVRRCRLALEIAIGHAVDHERRFLIAQDLIEAVKLLGDADGSKPIGFVHHPAASD